MLHSGLDQLMWPDMLMNTCFIFFSRPAETTANLGTTINSCCSWKCIQEKKGMEKLPVIIIMHVVEKVISNYYWSSQRMWDICCSSWLLQLSCLLDQLQAPHACSCILYIYLLFYIWQWYCIWLFNIDIQMRNRTNNETQNTTEE